jgi:outer membrane murein-binding lipoprotein Lpp
MTEQPPADPYGILAAISQLTHEMRVGFAGLGAQVDQVGAHVSAVDGKVEQLRADVAAIKAENAIREGYVIDIQDAVRRHLGDPGAHGGRAAA